MAKEKPNQTKRHFTLGLPDEDWTTSIAEFKADYLNRNIPEVIQALRDRIFKLALNGIKLQTIAAMYNVEFHEFNEVFGDTWRAGHAGLVARIAARTVEVGFKTENPVPLIWLGKSMGGLSDNPSAIEVITNGGPGSGSAEVNLNINVVRRNPEDGQQ